MHETLRPHEAIFYLLHHTGDMLERQLDQTLQEQLGIGMSQYRILALLSEGAEQGQRMVAQNLGQTEAAVSRQVGLLGKKGYIQGRINEKNRRQHLIAITPKGLKLLEAARQSMARNLGPLDVSIPDKQQKHLQELLTAIHAWTCPKGRTGACNHPYGL